MKRYIFLVINACTKQHILRVSNATQNRSKLNTKLNATNSSNLPQSIQLLNRKYCGISAAVFTVLVMPFHINAYPQL